MIRSPGNSLDAFRLTGLNRADDGLIRPVVERGAGHENHVLYKAAQGIHGTDTFTYANSDCLEFGPDAEVRVEVIPTDLDNSGKTFTWRDLPFSYDIRSAPHNTTIRSLRVYATEVGHIYKKKSQNMRCL